MRAAAGVAAFATAAVLTFWCREVEAYRPFDGTDAAVADTGDVEIELGPVEYLRGEPSARCSHPTSESITASHRVGKPHSKVKSRMV